MVHALQDVAGEPCDHKFRDEGLFRLLELLFDSDHIFEATTVHVLHKQVNLSLIQQAPVVAHNHRTEGLNHVKLVVELLSLVFVKEVDDL